MAWTEVFAFAHDAAAAGGAARGRGVVRRVDPTIAQAEVLLDAPQGAVVALDPADCTEALCEVVARGAPAVRVEAEVDLVARRAVRLVLAVDEAQVAARLARGALRAEEWLVHLARGVWREARVGGPPSARPEGDAAGGDDAPLRGRNEGRDAPLSGRDGGRDEGRDAPLSGRDGGRDEGRDGPDDDVAMAEAAPAAWRAEFPLYAHQARTVAWMRAHEERLLARAPLVYAGNLLIARAGGAGGDWYLDTEGECLTRDPSWREAHLAGGVCADGTGAGKTASVLRLVAETRGEVARAGEGRYRARGTLVILPLNLVAQWHAEVRKFLDGVRVVDLAHARGLRETTMEALLEADLVVTTFHFLRGAAYAELADSALGGRPRTRAALAAWTRQPNHREPLVEAVAWRRVVVDEMHEAFGSARDLRQLRLLTADALWGLTATPELDTEAAQHLYLLLRREKPHHPNLLAALIASAVRAHAPHHRAAGGPHAAVAAAPAPALRLVRLEDAAERAGVDAAGDDVRGAVLRAGEEGSARLRQVGELLSELRGEPVILFVQWKAMVRGTRAALRGLEGVRVLLLDGNLAQRAATLAEFQHAGGVLLLCLEECIAGLHLPHARHVVFAHALVGDRERVARLERQAIARCARPGQEGAVRVYSYVVADGAEEALWRETHGEAREGGGGGA